MTLVRYTLIPVISDNDTNLIFKKQNSKAFHFLKCLLFFFSLNVKFENLIFLIHILIVDDLQQVGGFSPQIKLTTTI